jgi:hypothetical protein
VSESRVLRRIFGPRRKEVPGSWKTIVMNMYLSSDTVRFVKSVRMIWAGICKARRIHEKSI